jgi:hypothetical protein
MSGNDKDFGSSKWTMKRRNKRLATEDVENILKEAEGKKNRPNNTPLGNNTPHLVLSDVNTSVHSDEHIQVRVKSIKSLLLVSKLIGMHLLGKG